MYPCVGKRVVYVQCIFRRLYFPLLVQLSRAATEGRGEAGAGLYSESGDHLAFL